MHLYYEIMAASRGVKEELLLKLAFLFIADE